MREDPTFFELADQLDDLIALQDPGTEQVEEAIRLIADEALEQYFFKHLAESRNLTWFEPLREQGLLTAEPEPLDRAGVVSPPQWPPLRYLIAVAEELPEAVVDLAHQIRGRAPFVFLELVRAARKMSPQHAVRLVPLVARWTDEGMPAAEDVASLATHLAQGDQWEGALKLIELILSPKEGRMPRRAVTRAQKYFVQDFVRQGLAYYLAERPMEILAIVERNLVQALEIEGHRADASSIGWRPAIEPHEQNWGFDEAKDLLVDAAVQALDHIVEAMPDQGRAVVEAYLGHARSIFRRMAVYSVRRNAAVWPDLVERLLADEQYLDEPEDYHVYHEYWMLMNETFGSLPTSTQGDFVRRLLRKLPSNQERDQTSYHLQRHWVLRLLWAIREFLPSDEHRDVIAGLVSEYGEPEHPSFLSYSYSVVGPKSPKTAEDLVNMPHDEILAELKRQLPSRAFDQESEEGLARSLKDAVADAPNHFAPIAPQLLGQDISPVYTCHALWGFREAWKEKELEWEPVLGLCDGVCRTRDQEPDDGSPADTMPDYWTTTYASARGAVADLLEAGVTRSDRAISSRLLPKVRDILCTLASDLNPSPEYEQRRIADEVPYGVLTIALNVTRGKAVEALLRYTLHVARTGSDEQEEAAPARRRIEDEVRGVLTEKLDKQIDPSLAVHSLFGKYLPSLCYLDREWLVCNLERILPRQPEMADYWEAAWDGYMFRSDFSGHLYEEMLKPYYCYALDQLGLGKQGRAGSDASRTRLAQHLALLYWHGTETLGDDSSLVARFFGPASDGLRAGFIGLLGSALREEQPEADSCEWLRLKTLWESRFRTIAEAVENGRHPSDYVLELSAFTRWVPFIPGDLEGLYPMIRMATLAADEGSVGEVIEFLGSVAGEHASFAVSLLQELLEQGGRGVWFLWSGRIADHVRSILEAAAGSDDNQTRSCAVRVINLFGERGDERYRDLIARAGRKGE